MRIPFFSICIFMFVFEFVTALMRGLQLESSVLSVIDGLCYLIGCVGLFIYFVVTKIRLDLTLRKLNKRLQPDNLKERRFVRATRLVLGVSICLMGYIIGTIIIGLVGSFWEPRPYCLVWALIFWLSVLNSYFQVLLVRLPPMTWNSLFFGVFASSDTLPPASEVAGRPQTTPFSFGSREFTGETDSGV